MRKFSSHNLIDKIIVFFSWTDEEKIFHNDQLLLINASNAFLLISLAPVTPLFGLLINCIIFCFHLQGHIWGKLLLENEWSPKIGTTQIGTCKKIQNREITGKDSVCSNNWSWQKNKINKSSYQYVNKSSFVQNFRPLYISRFLTVEITSRISSCNNANWLAG